MAEKYSDTPETSTRDVNISFFEIARVVLKYKKLILCGALCFMVATFLFVHMSPLMYEASASVSNPGGRSLQPFLQLAFSGEENILQECKSERCNVELAFDAQLNAITIKFRAPDAATAHKGVVAVYEVLQQENLRLGLTPIAGQYSLIAHLAQYTNARISNISQNLDGLSLSAATRRWPHAWDQANRRGELIVAQYLASNGAKSGCVAAVLSGAPKYGTLGGYSTLTPVVAQWLELSAIYNVMEEYQGVLSVLSKAELIMSKVIVSPSRTPVKTAMMTMGAGSVGLFIFLLIAIVRERVARNLK